MEIKTGFNVGLGCDGQFLGLRVFYGNFWGRLLNVDCRNTDCMEVRVSLFIDGDINIFRVFLF